MAFQPRSFELVSPFKPTGDQPTAIAQIVQRFRAGEPAVVLLGATGTGKTFTMANTIAQINRPTLIISHNKTLAAQLYEEMHDLFPRNAVSYFVSYYDYYQPEAYIPQRDIYIEKDSSRNDDLDRLRLAATSNLLSRKDTVVVASVSCIFGLGSPDAYRDKVMSVQIGQTLNRREFLLGLADMQYQRSDIDFKRGTYRVVGDVIELYPAYEQFAVRFELFGDEVESIQFINPTTGEILATEKHFFIFPAVHYVTPADTLQSALASIRAELDTRVMQLRHEGKLLEAQRLLARTKFDLEMLEEVGTCPGVENYSRYFDGRLPGERPYTLMDYLRRSAELDGGTPDDWLLIIDESHVTIPQISAMFNGDKARKTTLVEHGFRLPSALDNRPLRFEEFETIVPRCLYVSATPGPYELKRTGGEIAEQVIRPTGLLDPVVEVKPARGQVPDLLEQCKERVAQGERVLVTALTKRLCEQLATYLDEQGIKVRYLHSDIETLDRLEILRDLRTGEFDVLVGVNLLREGLDLPEVSLVAILDADKEGFLRSPTSLIQLIGRAARNVNGRAIMYADEVTPSMRAAIGETDRRREKQVAYNESHGITPETIRKAIRRGIEDELRGRKTAKQNLKADEESFDIVELRKDLEGEMLEAAVRLEFEKAAALRDQVETIKKIQKADPSRTRVKMSELERELYGEEGARATPGKPGAVKRKRKRMKRTD
ncbi:MAG: excinuclease ABC subunit UvrB [Phycisphaeraceae bacterium]|nr:excinuclease ABC subunit UvrB [Phycisphaeraceae bacterium]